MDSSRLAFALRNGWGAFEAARAGDQRGADLGQWGKLSSVMAKLAGDATDKRRRLWRMKVPALAAALATAVTIWVLVVRETIPEDQRSSADAVAIVLGMVISSMLGLLSRWRLDLRLARARKRIMQPPYVGHDGDVVAFSPAHVLMTDGSMIAAVDPERRLVRVIAPVFFGFDVVFPVDASIHSARLTHPKLTELQAVANMPVVSSDVSVVSTLFIFVKGADEPARFTIQESELPVAEKWMKVFAGWVKEDAAWSSNLAPVSRA